MGKTANLPGFLQKCEKENLVLPENPYEASIEAVNALKETGGDEEAAIEQLRSKLGGKDSHKRGQDGSELEPHHDPKRTRLMMEVRGQPARRKENQKIVDAFLEYAEAQLDRGHTGKGSTHLRAAKEIHASDIALHSGADARQIGFIGDTMARQVDQILAHGKIEDDTGELNVSKDYHHNQPQIVHDIRNSSAKRKENQKLVDVLADFGEHELEYGNTGKGTSHLRAAKELHNTDEVITSGAQARAVVGFIGDVMVDKIDQILAHGKIIRDDSDQGYHQHRRVAGEPAPIVQDLRNNPAKKKENQLIVDRLTDYGESHLTSGHRGTGISHLRAAREIRKADTVVQSGASARQIGMVGGRVAQKIDQILRDGHADDDEDYHPGDDEEEPEGTEYGSREKVHIPPIVEDIRSRSAAKKENQRLVDALTDYGEEQLKQKHTGRGITYLRAAREIQNTSEVIKSGQDAKKVAVVGDKVADFVENCLKQ
ncbi:unnamed protein product [Albugo candida]|nr:unnamed protein product [Albugo candida]|eukprot:CCI44846.1 unnamed protein product [Albugo candida]